MPAKKPRSAKPTKQLHASSHTHTNDIRRDDVRKSACCCPPEALIWIDSRTHCCFVENQIDMKRRLLARADANAAIRAPGGPEVDAEGAGGSQLDEGTMKPQGKVYRVDEYTIHWQAIGQCRPLSVSLVVNGDRNYIANGVPETGQVALSVAYMLEPDNDYDPTGKVGITAVLTVIDCAGNRVQNRNTAQRP